MLGLQSAQMLGGSVVIETVFSVPGLGRLAQEAVASRDTPLLLGIILVSAVLVIAINLVVDIALRLARSARRRQRGGRVTIIRRFLRTPEGAGRRPAACRACVLVALAAPLLLPARPAVDRRAGAAATFPGLVAAARHRPARPRRAGRHLPRRAHLAGGRRLRQPQPRSPSARSSARWPASPAAWSTRC